MAEKNFYLKIEGVPGEVTDKVLPGSMELQSWNWDTTRPVSGSGGGGGGHVKFDQLQFTMETNKATPILFQAASSGQHFSKAVMIGSQNSNEFMRADFVDIQVSGVQHVGSSDSDSGPLDIVKIQFANMTIHYTDAKSMAYQGSGTSYSLKTAGS